MVGSSTEQLESSRNVTETLSGWVARHTFLDVLGALKLSEQAALLLKEAASTTEGWMTKYDKSIQQLTEEGSRRERTEEQLDLRSTELSEAKWRLELVETQLGLPEGLVQEITDRMETERTEHKKAAGKWAKDQEKLKAQVAEVPELLELEKELAGSNTSENFLYTLWLEHPEMDFSFFSGDVLEVIKKFKDEARAQETVSAVAHPSVTATSEVAASPAPLPDLVVLDPAPAEGHPGTSPAPPTDDN